VERSNAAFLFLATQLVLRERERRGRGQRISAPECGELETNDANVCIQQAFIESDEPSIIYAFTY